MFTFLFEYLCSVLEGIYLEVKLMSLTFGGAAKLLSIMVGILYSLCEQKSLVLCSTRPEVPSVAGLGGDRMFK